MLELASLADEDFCYLTTTGRVSGRAHTIEIWFAFAAAGRTLYLLSGGGKTSDWVKNLLQQPDVQLRIKDQALAGRARLLNDPQEDALARKLLFEKYTPRDSDDLTEWARTSLPVAVDLHLQER